MVERIMKDDENVILRVWGVERTEAKPGWITVVFDITPAERETPAGREKWDAMCKTTATYRGFLWCVIFPPGSSESTSSEGRCAGRQDPCKPDEPVCSKHYAMARASIAKKGIPHE
jgi:hypothetical protein